MGLRRIRRANRESSLECARRQMHSEVPHADGPQQRRLLMIESAHTHAMFARTQGVGDGRCGGGSGVVTAR